MSLDRALEFVAGARAIFGQEVVRSDAFWTEKVRGRESSPKKSIGVNPRGTSEGMPWSFRSLFTFLNELPDDWAISRNRAGSFPAKPDPRNLKIYHADGYGAGNKRVTVTIAADWTISVQMSRPDLVG
jgi:hypothetical protein